MTKRYLKELENAQKSDACITEKEFLTDYISNFGAERTMELSASKLVFISTRANLYRKKLEELGVDVEELLKELNK